jgi:uncharacterized protein
MGRLFVLAILAMMVYFSLKSLFRPIKKPEQGPVFKKQKADDSTEMAQDPECGVYVDPAKAVSLSSNGVTRYFCSEACRDNFQNKLEQGANS